MSDNSKQLEEKMAEALKGGGEKRIAKQHQQKKLTARERVDYLWTKVLLRRLGSW